MDIGYYKKNGPGNYQQIVNLKALDICALHNNLENFQFIKPQAEWFNLTFPGLFHQCPYTVDSALTLHFLLDLDKRFQDFLCYNATLLRDNDMTDFSPAWLPVVNGHYKMIFKIYNDDEKNIIRLVYHQETQIFFADQKY